MSSIRLDTDRGVRLSQANRTPAEAAYVRQERRKATRFVLSWCHDMPDNVVAATELLAALGLDPAEALDHAPMGCAVAHCDRKVARHGVCGNCQSTFGPYLQATTHETRTA